MSYPVCSPNFNPRSHEGSDCAGAHLGLIREISIHAPTRGATTVELDRQRYQRISIHAPTRGATRLRKRLRRKQLNFNPRSHEGSDGWQERRDEAEIKFQSTLPRGERHLMVFICILRQNFNPRSHEGSDSNFRQKVLFSLSKNCLKYLILTTNYFK